MRALPALLLLLALPLLAEEEKKEKKPPPDPVESLPKCLKPGAEAKFTDAGLEKALRGDVMFFAEKGLAKGTVRLVRDYAATGSLRLRSRLVAVLDAKSKTILSFAYDTGRDDKLAPRAKLGPDPKREGGLVHVRFDVDDKGKVRKKTTRLNPEGRWAPDLLEPFLVGLVEIGEEKPGEVRLMDVTRGRIDKRPARYRWLGQGVRHQAGGKEELACRILQRELRKTSGHWYFRKADLMPVSAAGLVLKSAGGERPKGEKPK
ncbi:MAG: hypothetical protein ACYTDY_05280 [Planctomycetota bacterium]